MEAVRQAIAKLGQDVALTDLLKYIKQTYGVTLDRTVAYTYKNQAIKQAAGTKPKARKPGRKPAAVAARGSSAVAIGVEDIRAVKALADRIGAEKVAQLAKVLA
jgi:hypothetical protein